MCVCVCVRVRVCAQVCNPPLSRLFSVAEHPAQSPQEVMDPRSSRTHPAQSPLAAVANPPPPSPRLDRDSPPAPSAQLPPPNKPSPRRRGPATHLRHVHDALPHDAHVPLQHRRLPHLPHAPQPRVTGVPRGRAAAKPCARRLGPRRRLVARARLLRERGGGRSRTMPAASVDFPEPTLPTTTSSSPAFTCPQSPPPSALRILAAPPAVSCPHSADRDRQRQTGTDS